MRWVDAGDDGKDDEDAETVKLERGNFAFGGDKTAVYDGSCYQYNVERFHGVVVISKPR